MGKRQLHTPSGSLFWLQGMQLLTIGSVAAVWSLVVPQLIHLPADVAERIRSYVVYLLPLIGVMPLFTHALIGPAFRQWEEIVSGELDPERSDRYLGRIVSYPYHAFIVTLVSLLAITTLVSLIQIQAHRPPTWIIVELAALALALGLVAACLVFFVGRRLLAPYLRLPGILIPRVRWELDARKSLLLAVICVALVSWVITAVLVFDHQHHLASTLAADTVGNLAALHPAVVDTVFWLIAGGIVFVIVTGLGAYLAAGDLIVESGDLAGKLHQLADEAEENLRRGGESIAEFKLLDPELRQLSVLAADEVGQLAAAYNGLAERITEAESSLRQEALRAERAERRQMDFLTTVSSDLRTPLHTIIGFSEVLQEEIDGPLNTNQREDVEAILRAGRHLLALVGDVVDLTRIEAGSVSIAPEALDLQTEVEQILDAAQGLCAQGAVELVSAVDGGLPPVWADRTRLRQILFNLVGNAIKFTNEGQVVIRASCEDGDAIQVVVEDSGPGIPEGSLDRVFGEFEQVRTGKPDKAARGTGLGLTITRRLVELQGGRIEARNRSDGGAAFLFTLPCAAAEEGS